MYPLLLSPAFKDYLWGGQRLRAFYDIDSSMDKVAEAWVFSCHSNGHSTVQNGEMAGKTLAEALAAWNQPQPQILVKLIDACDRLSLQVHPDDAYAREHHQSLGKTEMWYVLDAEPGAELICGFEQEITTEEFAAHIAAGTPEQVVCHVPVSPGDVLFISPGTVHAIGAGILLAEVQQNSDITYRVWDWGRVGADGKPRQLHVEQALAVSQTKPYPLTGKHPDSVKIPGGQLRTLAQCPYFSTYAMELEDTANLPGDIRCVLCTRGSAVLMADGCETVSLCAGACVYIPTGLSVTLSGNADLLWIK